MNRALVAEKVEEYLKGTDQYPVDVRIEAGDRIVVEIGGDRPVSIDDCIALTRYLETQFNRDEEDYELEVGSAGISQPFKVLRQYLNAVGQEVEVLPKSGKKLSGILKEADGQAIVLLVTRQVKPEGAKLKIQVEEELRLPLDTIKYTKNIIKI
jgi:ribosome maturation factor RimP